MGMVYSTAGYHENERNSSKRLKILLAKHTRDVLSPEEYHEAVQLIFSIRESDHPCRFCQRRGMRDAARTIVELTICKGCASVCLSQRIIFD